LKEAFSSFLLSWVLVGTIPQRGSIGRRDTVPDAHASLGPLQIEISLTRKVS
jgi:hypothetical protein